MGAAPGPWTPGYAVNSPTVSTEGRPLRVPKLTVVPAGSSGFLGPHMGSEEELQASRQRLRRTESEARSSVSAQVDDRLKELGLIQPVQHESALARENAMLLAELEASKRAEAFAQQALRRELSFPRQYSHPASSRQSSHPASSPAASSTDGGPVTELWI